MVNVVIPVYNGVDLLHTPLDSLLKQTDKDFIVTIVQDFDGLDYTNIINEYKDKGLKIDHVKLPIRFKQGRARQIGLDSHKECEYVMFLDQDDAFRNYTIQVLQGKMKATGSDMVLSKFIKETKEDSEVVEQGHPEILTQHHGKIYSVAYLDKYDIKFFPNIDYAEDSSFNLKAYYCADKSTYTDIITYVWSYNEASESRNRSSEYYSCMLPDFITGQVEALLHVIKYNDVFPMELVLTSILSFYELSMIIRERNFPDRLHKEALNYLGKNKSIKELFKTNSAIAYFAEHVKGGTTHTKECIFFNYSFVNWVNEWLEK